MWDVLYNDVSALNYFNQLVPLVYTVWIKALSSELILNIIGWKTSMLQEDVLPHHYLPTDCECSVARWVWALFVPSLLQPCRRITSPPAPEQADGHTLPHPLSPSPSVSYFYPLQLSLSQTQSQWRRVVEEGRLRPTSGASR